MKGKVLWWAIGALAISGALVGAFFIGRASVSDTDSALLEELEILRAEQSEAAVIKRVSQQMEDIAYQQKAVSDIERERAEDQTRLAISMRDRAEQESRSAHDAEGKARIAAQEAKAERENALALRELAEMQRDEATLAKSIADTLTYRILGRTLGTSSLTQYDGGNENLAAQLAYASWYFLKLYGGNTYQNETFEALSVCSGSRGSIQTKKGGAVTAMSPIKGVGCIAVTDYGEVEMHRIIGSRRKILYQNNKYNFTGVWADTSVIYALSRRGPLCRMDYKTDKIEEIDVPAGTYLNLIHFSEDLLLLVEKNALYLLDKSTGETVADTALDGTVSTVLAVDGKIYVYYDDGRSATADSSLNVSPAESYAPQVVTAAHYDDDLCAFFLGCNDGNVLFLDRNRRLITTIYGHSSKVTDVVTAGPLAVTCSYDKKLLIWNLPLLHHHTDRTLAGELGISEELLSSDAHLSSNEWLAPATVEYESWPLSLCVISEDEVVAGTGNGQVQILNISTDAMARKIKNGQFTPMTSQEWGRYVGSTVPYVSF